MPRTLVSAAALLFVACNGDCGRQAPPKPRAEPTVQAARDPIPNPDPNDLTAPADIGAAPSDAERSASGLASKLLRPGTTQQRPRPFDVVRIHYTAWTADGKVFDSTRSRGEAAEVPLNQTIAGWTEGIPLMTVGEQRRFWIPPALAYQGRAGWPQGMLVYDIELISVIEQPTPPTAPPDLAAPPASAIKSPSGLVSLVLVPVKAQEHPAPHDVVTIHYSGWTQDGKLFDSSVLRRAPATFALNKAIAGWSEALRDMAVGEKRRIWVPPALAYEGQEGPRGTLVYDLELLDIRRMPAPLPAPKKEQERAPPSPPPARP